MEPPTDTASLRAQIANLQAELDSLCARYDTLLEAKTRAAEHYKADYKKWRDFKRWLFRDTETDDHAKSLFKDGELVAYMRASTLGKRKHFEEFGPNLEHTGKQDGETGSHTHEFARHVNVEHLHSSPAASRHQRRKSYHGGPPHKSCSDKVPLQAPQFTSRNDTSSVLVNNMTVPCKAEPSQPVPLAEPRKGKGRYALVPSGLDTINSRFSIRKDKNEGMDFQYDAVVRNRNERKHMLGSDCECCREYYEAVEPLPASRQPLWRTPTKRKTPYHPHTSDNDKENTEEVEKHKQLISRHRHHWHRPKTPPGYWDIGFPDTQEVLDINRRAAEMHKRKLVEVETDARNNNGRYMEHRPRTP